MKIVGNDNVSFTTYDKNDPFDECMFLLDSNDRIEQAHVRDIVSDLSAYGVYNDKGIELSRCMELLTDLIACNVGIGQDNYDRYKRFEAWLLKHKQDVPDILKKALEENKHLYEQKGDL